MPTDHVTHLLDNYVDHTLPSAEQHRVEAHLACCPTCARQLHHARHLAAELGPTLKAVFGMPLPPPALRHELREKVYRQPAGFSFSWAAPGKFLNAAGTMAVIMLLAAGAFMVVQGQLPTRVIFPEIDTAGGGAETERAAGPTPAPQHTVMARPTVSTGDTLQLQAAAPIAGKSAEQTGSPASGAVPVGTKSLVNNLAATESPLEPARPGGLIAFSVFNANPAMPAYEIHLIEPTGKNHRVFSLDGVSEPALRATPAGRQLAYRAWSQPTSPRSLLTSNLQGNMPRPVGGFWEDAQPDWSPIEERLIFASQRESDRHWRLYTIWGDGSAEVNLRREGRSPSFAPDGLRFVYEGCDDSREQCGLWQTNLEQSQSQATVILPDPLAQAPDWSPVGEQIAFMANFDDNWDLYVVNSDGKHVQRLTTDPAVDGLPVWSPDGEWLAFLSNRDHAWGIWLLHIASGETHPVYSIEEGSFTPPVGEPYGERNWWDEQLSWSE
jgi:anti-sigma factor RsiW